MPTLPGCSRAAVPGCEGLQGDGPMSDKQITTYRFQKHKGLSFVADRCTLVSSIERFGGASFSVVAGVCSPPSGELRLCSQALRGVRVNWGTHPPRSSRARVRCFSFFAFTSSPDGRKLLSNSILRVKVSVKILHPPEQIVEMQRSSPLTSSRSVSCALSVKAKKWKLAECARRGCASPRARASCARVH